MSGSQTKNAVIKKTGELMLSGWKLLATVCPICNTALLSKGSEIRCPCCDLPVVLESNTLRTSTNLTSSIGEEKCKVVNTASVDVPTSFEELKKEYDKKNRKQNVVSEKLGEKMIAGWTLLATSCPRGECGGTPLMSLRGGPMLCVACGVEYNKTDAGDPVQISRDNTAQAKQNSQSNSVPQAVPVPAAEVSVASKEDEDDEKYYEGLGLDFTSQIPILPMSSFASDANDTSHRISQQLLKGWALLDEVCTSASCNGCIPMMRDRDGIRRCVDCGYAVDASGKVVSQSSQPTSTTTRTISNPVPAGVKSVDVKTDKFHKLGPDLEDGLDDDDDEEEDVDTSSDAKFFSDWRERIRSKRNTTGRGNQDSRLRQHTKSRLLTAASNDKEEGDSVRNALAVLHRKLAMTSTALDACESVEKSLVLARLVQQLCAAIRSAQEIASVNNGGGIGLERQFEQEANYDSFF